jgi:hypothetical protein
MQKEDKVGKKDAYAYRSFPTFFYIVTRTYDMKFLTPYGTHC